MAEHSITLTDRRYMELTGIKNVITFDEEEIILESSPGLIFIVGQGMHITMLNLDEGKVKIEGEVQSFQYKPQGTDIKTRSKNIINRLLK
ncbi:sporulation protein YabP [Thermosyntropha lipolytica DSM 11003]|uniref:Sporulation protein YabP n=1 Tax=Thermosyntropha lipolytica DSM 11003 TaxID=1123382 RepID=A0A1M5JSY8_9FIRM|nr:sporulation protein YabP [Thermosyntropha lipolytica]SHG43654.1 sporulation protein YabP [Thermosyntropha lipolytica DSM 11003]